MRGTRVEAGTAGERVDVHVDRICVCCFTNDYVKANYNNSALLTSMTKFL